MDIKLQLTSNSLGGDKILGPPPGERPLQQKIHPPAPIPYASGYTPSAFASPPLRPQKEKTYRKKRRASSAGRHQIGDWHTAAVTKTANPAQNSNTAKLTERGYELVQITRHRFSFILSEKYSALAIGSDKFVATLACNIAGPGGGRRKSSTDPEIQPSCHPPLFLGGGASTSPRSQTPDSPSRPPPAPRTSQNRSANPFGPV